jgi:hypothetical protein
VPARGRCLPLGHPAIDSAAVDVRLREGKLLCQRAQVVSDRRELGLPAAAGGTLAEVSLHRAGLALGNGFLKVL